jgi:hypothetical protein
MTSRTIAARVGRAAAESPSLPTLLRRLSQAREALAYAADLDQGQRRPSDPAPAHPLEVAALLDNALTEDAGIEAFAERTAGLRDQIARYGAHARAVSAAGKGD